MTVLAWTLAIGAYVGLGILIARVTARPLDSLLMRGALALCWPLLVLTLLVSGVLQLLGWLTLPPHDRPRDPRL